MARLIYALGVRENWGRVDKVRELALSGALSQKSWMKNTRIILKKLSKEAVRLSRARSILNGTCSMFAKKTSIKNGDGLTTNGDGFITRVPSQTEAAAAGV